MFCTIDQCYTVSCQRQTGDRLPLYFGRIGVGRGLGICGGLAGIKGRGASSSRGRLLAQAGAWRTVRRYNDNDPFYRTRRWRHLRDVILRRDGYVCQASRRYGRRVAADTVHHVFPRETFPEYQWESWNLVSLCRAEHDALHDRNTGSLTDAKTADKTAVQPSLIIPGGVSITGGNDAAMNVTNAYVKIGSTSSKNSAANGTFSMNFTNSIVEFTNQLTFAEPTSGMNPTFNVNVVDSVLTTATKLCIAASNTNMVVDNSVVNVATYVRNSGNLTLKNSSKLTGATIQFGENGGNNGIINVDASDLTVNASSTGSAFDGKGTGAINLTSGAVATVTYYKAMTVTVDATSTFTGTEVQ